MTPTTPSTFLRELTNNNTVAPATSLEEARARPGTVCEVDEETYFYYLEVLPPQFMQARVFCFAEGAEPYMLFWSRESHFYARQLTWEETKQLAQLAGIPLPGNW